ncbi:alpha-type protein kinase, partial [Haematococcus lacustris]
LLGDLLTWDAVTGQHQVTRRGVQLELHHPHFAKDGSRLSGVELAPAGSEPQTCLMNPGQVVIAKEHRHKKAFSHWSWVHSSGQYLVCDIQGVGGRWTDVQVSRH